MNRLLITGATGFLGVPCVRHTRKTFEVHATARTDRAGWPPGVRFHPCDLLDRRAVTDLLAAVRPSHLLHLAWVTTPGEYWTSPDNHRWLDASVALLDDFFGQGGRRAVIAGTCAEYDWNGDGVCHERLTPTAPATLYGRCKNQLWDRLCGHHDRIAWARLFYLYGPAEHPSRLVPSVVRSLLSGLPADCTHGSQRRDFLHSDDAADAIASLLVSRVVGPVNIGSGTATAVRTVVETLGRICGRPDLVRLGTRPSATGDPPVLVADVSRLRDEVGWRPRLSLEEGLRDCVTWWRTARAA
jgi:nucleoside-diphosphate-sugar epimerase